MPYINVELSEESYALIAAAAKAESRSKREQFKVSALAHAKSIVPDFQFLPKSIGVSMSRKSGRATSRRKAGKGAGK